MTTAEIPGPRPQPIGALPWPAGMLLIPPVAGADEAAAKAAGPIPDPWPTDLAFLAWALDDEPAKAAATSPATTCCPLQPSRAARWR